MKKLVLFCLITLFTTLSTIPTVSAFGCCEQGGELEFSELGNGIKVETNPSNPDVETNPSNPGVDVQLVKVVLNFIYNQVKNKNFKQHQRNDDGVFNKQEKIYTYASKTFDHAVRFYWNTYIMNKENFDNEYDVFLRPIKESDMVIVRKDQVSIKAEAIQIY